MISPCPRAPVTFDYDATGNLTELSHVRHGSGGLTSVRTYAYATNGSGDRYSNRLVSTTVGSTTYPLSYDAHGNIVDMSHLPEVAYDAFDRMQSVQKTARTSTVTGANPAHDWFYVYDASGTRVRKVRAAQVGDGATPEVLVADGTAVQSERLYLGPFEVWRTVSSGAVQEERETLHLMDDQRRVAMVETLTWTAGAAVTSPTARWRYQLADALGSATVEVTETGAVISFEEYHPLGTTVLWSVASTSEVSQKRYRYTGMERDEETGLGYHSQRYYCPWLGRWMRPDPIGVRGGVNLFAYAAGDPVGKADRGGMSPDTDGPSEPVERFDVQNRALDPEASQQEIRDFVGGLGLAYPSDVEATWNPERGRWDVGDNVWRIGGAEGQGGAGSARAGQGDGPSISAYDPSKFAGFNMRQVATASWTVEEYASSYNAGTLDTAVYAMLRSAKVVVGELLGFDVAKHPDELFESTVELVSMAIPFGKGPKAARAAVPGAAAQRAGRPIATKGLAGEGDAVSDLLFGARRGDGLPGSAGVKISGRPTVTQLENLSEKHGVEFAVTYQLGPGKGGGGGQYWLFSGTVDRVRIPVAPDQMWIYHTHPGGTPWASSADLRVLRDLQTAGSPQRTSEVIPVGSGTTVPFRR